MKKIFIDCGGNQGQGLRHFIGKYNITSDWIVHTYEPYAACEIEKHITDLTYVQIHHQAVWDKSGTVVLSQEEKHEMQGSSIECLLDSGLCADKTNDLYRKHDDLVEVECADIHDIVDKYDKEDFIVVKIDIEGSEFIVLRRLLETGAIEKINELYVEWHTIYMSSESASSELALRTELIRRGCKPKEWY